MDPKQFWEELESRGLDEVRRRRAQNVYAKSERSLVGEWIRRQEATAEARRQRRSDELRGEEFRVAQRSLRARQISAIVAGISLLVSTAAILISLQNARTLRAERVTVRLQRLMADYPTELVERAGPLGPALVETYWECLVANTGERTISLVEADVFLEVEGGPMQYSDMNGGMLARDGTALNLPVSVEPGHTEELLFRLRPPVSQQAFELLKKAYPTLRLPSISAAEKALAAAETNFFGGQVTPFLVDGNVSGFRVETLEKQPAFRATLTTSRGKAVSAFAPWYPVPNTWKE